MDLSCFFSFFGKSILFSMQFTSDNAYEFLQVFPNEIQQSLSRLQADSVDEALSQNPQPGYFLLIIFFVLDQSINDFKIVAIKNLAQAGIISELLKKVYVTPNNSEKKFLFVFQCFPLVNQICSF